MCCFTVGCKNAIYITIYITLVFIQFWVKFHFSISRQCRRGLSIQCLELSSLHTTTTTTTTTMTTTTTSTDQFHGESLNPMDKEVSGWDDQMDVLNLKECTSYTCKVSYPKVEGVVFLSLFSKIHGYRQLTLHSEKILSSHLEVISQNVLRIRSRASSSSLKRWLVQLESTQSAKSPLQNLSMPLPSIRREKITSRCVKYVNHPHVI